MEPTPDDRGTPKGPRSEVRRYVTPQVMSFYPRFEAKRPFCRPAGWHNGCTLKSITAREKRGKMQVLTHVGNSSNPNTVQVFSVIVAREDKSPSNMPL